MKRIVYHVLPHRGSWRVKSRGFWRGLRYENKEDALGFARDSARIDYHVTGEYAQVVVRDRRGRFQKEWTYGRDPRRSEG